MGRKARQNRHHDDDDNAHDDEKFKDTTTASKLKFKGLDFAQRRELQREQAKEKRKSKQKCYLCGETGHVRRECPGIKDDGRGMSRYKGKSDPKLEKQKYRARKYGEGLVEIRKDQLEYPEGFASCFLGQEKSTLSMYFDTGCDLGATMEYLRSGRGKHRISHREALEEYESALEYATDSCYLGAMISKTYLSKPGKPWIDPSSLNDDMNTNVFYVLGLSSAFVNENQQEETIQALMETLETHSNKIIGFRGSLNYEPDFVSKAGENRDSQLYRLRCCCEAAGRADVPLQIDNLPGAAGLDPQESVAGTDYAKVLLDVQVILTESVSKYPEFSIHFSCWSGRADHMISLLKAFPKNLKAIGMDGSVSFAKATHLHECAFEVPLESLVLETSTVIPSHVANLLGRDASFHSGWWPFVAQAVAHYKQVPIDEIVRAACENALLLYPKLQNVLERQPPRLDGDNSQVATG